jgi:ubiquinone/menaquinone biosynthesis C-methylase UbiE
MPEGLIIVPTDYARWRESRLGSLTESIEQRAVLSHCGAFSGRDVLDLGCGDGTCALLAAKKGASVVGLDISPGMLAAAQSRAAAEGAKVRWRQASIAALPFAAGTFDVLVAVTVFCFSSDPGLAFKEAARALRPGGSLVVGELGRYSTWAVSRRIRG